MEKELSVKIYLFEAIEKIPSYAKFIKELVTKKRLLSYEDIGGLHHCCEIIS